MKRIMTHEKSDMHKEIVDYEEMEVYFNGIWFRVEIIKVSQIPI